ncbi:MAG TPA: hypothetical protein VEF34_07865 [Syntrophobacteraceae bacterium]|nr:hypothetical protein [Syntrophobacteraceae bacterium]
MKSYSCSECKANFLRLFNSVQFKVKRSGSVSRKSKRELAVITLTVIITVYLSYRIVVYLYDLGVQHVEQ